jgi:hypothetical protein
MKFRRSIYHHTEVSCCLNLPLNNLDCNESLFVCRPVLLFSHRNPCGLESQRCVGRELMSDVRYQMFDLGLCTSTTLQRGVVKMPHARPNRFNDFQISSCKPLKRLMKFRRSIYHHTEVRCYLYLNMPVLNSRGDLANINLNKTSHAKIKIQL